MTVSNRNWRSAILLYGPVLAWIGVILFLSSGQGASTRTSLIIRPVLEWLFPEASFETIAYYHGVIRKCAHLIEYAVLGFLACRAFSVYRYTSLLAALLVFTVAAIDETNQSANPERTGSVVDVLIDLCGGLAAIGLFYLLTRRRGSTL